MNWVHHFWFAARYSLVYCPFEAITAHALVSLKPDDLCELPHTDLLDLSVEVKKVFGAQRVE
ncbi:hypothetical protein C666_17600 [Thauera linaloolentis 47Lol = DSM 12138]|uniref:Uncharacterized protein n=1 Tax=Thauera linaloolentis (strain DSM 12138 / JCM 21573 / CCUG 41526 / CIP 105981 / IAM 15112 / NBRC 102519 / 47Lol) TaxID=1123367 RepID=N6YPY4_THAL4|nr:hypothetical protein C666_17600 [Thauera linaloolentis 47Lol = DSM 12138]